MSNRGEKNTESTWDKRDRERCNGSERDGKILGEVACSPQSKTYVYDYQILNEIKEECQEIRKCFW